jgi:hypothetical protein
MASRFPNRRLALAVPAALGIAVVLGTAAHEAGHAVTAMLCSQPIHSIGVAPGVEVYPQLRRVRWDGWIAYVDHGEPPQAWQAGLCKFMGSGTTALLAYGLIGAAALAGRGRPFARMVLLTAGIVFAWDILMYAAMPQFGLRHGVFVGGSDPEPLLGAQRIGIPLPLVWTLLALHAVAFHVWLWRCLPRWREPAIM